MNTNWRQEAEDQEQAEYLHAYALKQVKNKSRRPFPYTVWFWGGLLLLSAIGTIFELNH